MYTKTINLKTGILFIPEEFVLIKETQTDNADFAGIVANKAGAKTHYVVLSEKSINSLNDSEEGELIEIVKQKEHDSESVYGLFAVPEVENPCDLFLGTGIVRGGRKA